ncbi:MAG: tRNA (adenosine(37)-N6)-dimethylallyltransferase MiaA [Synergistaceae bacterium]|jgi:tRNA dimethylallyltransferase|nr:tRNA (adenosine(37)-N6)-dimethylallyltransferase MiaA [Synergistaceae bacterium]
MGERVRALAVIGPTAVGKTALSLDLARMLDAEVISVDSRQVYRYMDVGTDKVSPDLRREILHHGVDVVDPDETFTVAAFLALAESAARRIVSRGRVPLFVGGTPFYYDALFRGMLNANLPGDPGTRRRFEQAAETDGADALHRMLASVDPATAARLHPNDVRRVSRALEIYELTGRPPSELYGEGEKIRSSMDVLYVGLNRPRADLFENIATRARQQFASGYPEEVVWLIENGFDERFPSMQGFGYRELAAWYRGTMTMEEALEGDIRRTKAFCRRQMTWFGKFSPTLWYDTSALSGRELRTRIFEEMWKHLEGKNQAKGKIR